MAQITRFGIFFGVASRDTAKAHPSAVYLDNPSQINVVVIIPAVGSRYNEMVHPIDGAL